MVNDIYSSENAVILFKYWVFFCFVFFFFLRKANVAVMNFASEMGKLIREILLLVHKSQKRVLISGYPSLIKSHLKLNVNVQLNSHYF